MAAPAYSYANYIGSAEPVQDLIAMIETQLTSAGWTFVEQYGFTQGGVARFMRIWKNPSTLNAAAVDYYIGLVRNQAAGGTYFAVRAMEVWNTGAKTMTRPVLPGTGNNYFVNATQRISYGGGTYLSTSPGVTTSSTSTDAITWTTRLMPSAATWLGSAYGAGTWAVVGQGTAAASSTDGGATWTARTLPTTQQWRSVAYGAGLFVAVGGTTATTNYATSPDGITWTTRTNLPSGTWSHIVFAGGQFLAISGQGAGSTVAATSPDGLTWTTRTLSLSSAWNQIAYGNGLYLVTSSTASTASYMTSPDGITWTTRTFPQAGAWTATYGTMFVVLIFNGGTQTYLYSTDGINWTTSTSSFPMLYVTDVVYGDKYVAVPSATQAQAIVTTSADGITWTLRNGPATLSDFTLTDYAATVASTAISESTQSMAASTAFDIAILASRSYLALDVKLNGSANNQFSMYVGLFQPAYADSPSTNPPLVNLTYASTSNYASTNGVSRAMRANVGLGVAQPFSASVQPETMTLGNWSAATKDPTTQSIRGSRVAVIGGGNTSSISGVNLRGYLYDCVAVGTGANQNVLKVADTITVGGVTYTALGQSRPDAVVGSNASGANFGLFFNTATGT